MSNGGPNLWANIASRKAGGRAMRRAAEARAREELSGLSVPAAKKLIRRKKGKK